MYNISVDYEIVNKKIVDIDLDKFIDLVLKDIKNTYPDIDIDDSFVDDYIYDNIEDYLFELIGEERAEISQFTLDTVQEEFMSRIRNTHKELLEKTPSK